MRSLILLFCCVLGLSAPALPATFSTIAGSGAAGVSDGPANGATFLMPYGVAVFHGTIYVTDFLGQRVRAIDPNGTVRTVAGGGALGPDGLSVRGGYRDGAALDARFDGPAGIAIDASGRIFVADSRNDCIRVIEGGRVRTYAGAPSRSYSDGPLSSAGFDEPVALAIDQDGTMYVGDFNAGVRKITKDGAVGTIALPPGFDTTVTSIVPKPWGLLIANGRSMIWLRHPGATPPDYDATIPEAPFPFELSNNHRLFAQDDVATGYPFQVTNLTGEGYAYTDPRRMAVRLFDNYFAFADSLSESPAENYSAFGGGYQDGPIGKVQVPLGIASLGASAVVFADAGNRRIRKISNIETRQYASPSTPFGDYSDGQKNYRILIISGCYGAWGVPFSASLAGRLEERLEAERSRLGIPRRVRVATIWIGTVGEVRDYARDVLSSGVADLVVWEFNDGMPNEEWVPERDNLTTPLKDIDFWRNSMQPKLVSIGKSLREAGVPFYVLAVPTPLYFPASELTYRDLTHPPLEQTRDWPQMSSIYQTIFTGNADGFVDAGTAMFAQEKLPDHRLMFLTTGAYQLSAAGQAVVTDALFDTLAHDRPWAPKH